MANQLQPRDIFSTSCLPLFSFSSRNQTYAELNSRSCSIHWFSHWLTLTGEYPKAHHPSTSWTQNCLWQWRYEWPLLHTRVYVCTVFTFSSLRKLFHHSSILLFVCLVVRLVHLISESLQHTPPSLFQFVLHVRDDHSHCGSLFHFNFDTLSKMLHLAVISIDFSHHLALPGTHLKTFACGTVSLKMSFFSCGGIKESFRINSHLYLVLQSRNQTINLFPTAQCPLISTVMKEKAQHSPFTLMATVSNMQNLHALTKISLKHFAFIFPFFFAFPTMLLVACVPFSSLFDSKTRLCWYCR